jgi:hypothetical protein
MYTGVLTQLWLLPNRILPEHSRSMVEDTSENVFTFFGRFGSPMGRKKANNADIN